MPRFKENDKVVAALRNAGHDVYDFRNPPLGNPGFYWTDVDEHCADWTPNIYMPWEHMTSEPFWHWVTEGSTTEAYLDDDLYYMIHHGKSARIALKNTLIEML